jgi:hypothetical protein
MPLEMRFVQFVGLVEFVVVPENMVIMPATKYIFVLTIVEVVHLKIVDK